MTPVEMYDEMMGRCEHVWVFDRVSVNMDEAAAAMGAIVRAPDDGFLAVEIGIGVDGVPYAVMRSFGADGAQRPFGLLEADETLMVTG